MAKCLVLLISTWKYCWKCFVEVMKSSTARLHQIKNNYTTNRAEEKPNLLVYRWIIYLIFMVYCHFTVQGCQFLQAVDSLFNTKNNVMVKCGNDLGRQLKRRKMLKISPDIASRHLHSDYNICIQLFFGIIIFYLRNSPSHHFAAWKQLLWCQHWVKISTSVHTDIFLWCHSMCHSSWQAFWLCHPQVKMPILNRR